MVSILKETCSKISNVEELEVITYDIPGKGIEEKKPAEE